MFSNIILIAVGISFFWLLFLSFYLYRISSHYNKLTKGVNEKNLKTVIENMLKNVSSNTKNIESLKNYCDTIEKEGKLHIQKVGLLRFNPFKDTGGDQSFILSLLDGNDTGVIISGLFSRTGTRWYAKRVAQGKGVDYELSEEEQKALKNSK
jgi:hypothetical protein